MSILRFVFFIGILPLLWGLAFGGRNERLFSVWAKGYLINVGSALVPGIACCLLQTSLHTFVILWLSLTGAVLAASFVVSAVRRREDGESWKERAARLFAYRQPVLAEAVMIVLILAQVMIPVFFVHIDDDDATYVAMATAAVDTDTVFSYHPLTGSPIESVYDRGTIIREDIRRYAISPLFLYYSAESSLTGIRPVIFCHTAIPPVLTLIGYIFFYKLGTALFGTKRREDAASFVIFAAVWNIFSYVSVYTAGTFMLIRIWQGKGQFAGVLVPALLAFWIARQRKGTLTPKTVIYLGLLIAAAAMMTPMGGMLALIVSGIMMLMIMVRDRSLHMLKMSWPAFVVPVTVLVFYALKLT